MQFKVNFLLNGVLKASVQNQICESENDFMSPVWEEARYCNFDKTNQKSCQSCCQLFVFLSPIREEARYYNTDNTKTAAKTV